MSRWRIAVLLLFGFLVPRLRLGTHVLGGSASHSATNRGRASQAARSQAEPGNEELAVLPPNTQVEG